MSPLLTTVSELMSGATELRYYNYMPHLIKKWEMLHNFNLSIMLHEVACTAWCNLWINFSCSLLVSLSFILVFLCKFMRVSFVEDTVSLGLLMTTMVTLSNYFSTSGYFVWQFSTNISSLERVQAWVETGDFEDELDKKILKKEWPVEGRFLSVMLRRGIEMGYH